MTDNIQKLYEVAGVRKVIKCVDDTCGEPTKRCKDCPDFRENYPPFTAEKQLGLEKRLLLLNIEEPLNITFSGNGDYVYIYYMDVPEIDLKQFEEDDITVNPYTEQLWIKSLNKSVDFCNETFQGSGKTRGEALAGLILQLWDELSEEEREEVRGILR